MGCKDRDVFYTSIPREHVSEVSCVTMEVVKSAMTTCVLGIVMRTHTGATVRGVTTLVDMEPVKAIGHVGNAHILDSHVYSSPSG